MNEEFSRKSPPPKTTQAPSQRPDAKILRGVYCDLHGTLMPKRFKAVDNLTDEYEFNKDLWRALCGLINKDVVVHLISNGDIESDEKKRLVAFLQKAELPKGWHDGNLQEKLGTVLLSKRALRGQKLEILVDNLSAEESHSQEQLSARTCMTPQTAPRALRKYYRAQNDGTPPPP